MANQEIPQIDNKENVVDENNIDEKAKKIKEVKDPKNLSTEVDKNIQLPPTKTKLLNIESNDTQSNNVIETIKDPIFRDLAKLYLKFSLEKDVSKSNEFLRTLGDQLDQLKTTNPIYFKKMFGFENKSAPLIPLGMDKMMIGGKGYEKFSGMNNRVLETTLKKMFFNGINLYENTDFETKSGLTQEQYQDLKNKGNFVSATTTKSITTYEVDGPNKLSGGWNFIASNVDSAPQEAVSNLKNQIQELKSNPNINPNSIKVIIKSSASNIPYTGPLGNNMGLALGRGQKIQSRLDSAGLGANTFEIKPLVQGPTYPPTQADLNKVNQSLGITNNPITLQNWQQNMNVLEANLYRPYQRVDFEISYKEKKQEEKVSYNVTTKKDIYSDIKEIAKAHRFDVFVDYKTIVDNYDLLEDKIKNIKDTDPNLAIELGRLVGMTPSKSGKKGKDQLAENAKLTKYEWLKENHKGSQQNNFIKIKIDTAQDSVGSGLTSFVNTAHVNQSSIKQTKFDQPLYSFVGNDVLHKVSQEQSKVPSRKIDNIEVLTSFIDLVSNPNSTDKEIKDFFDKNLK